MYSTCCQSVLVGGLPHTARDSTYIRVPPDLLDGLVIKMAGVPEEILANLVCMLQTVKHVVDQRHLAALLQVLASVLAGGVDVLDPSMMGRSRAVIDVLLELDDIRVGNNLGIRRGENRGMFAIDGFSPQARRC